MGDNSVFLGNSRKKSKMTLLYFAEMTLLYFAEILYGIECSL